MLAVASLFVFLVLAIGGLAIWLAGRSLRARRAGTPRGHAD